MGEILYILTSGFDVFFSFYHVTTSKTNQMTLTKKNIIRYNATIMHRYPNWDPLLIMGH